MTAGCAPVANSARPATTAAQHEGAAGAPRASLVSVEDDPNAISVSSAIRKVTVYSDRALVSREAAVKLTAAPAVFAFKRLPGWVDEGSVRAATSSGRILDVRVVRSYLARATEPKVVKAEERTRILKDRLLALDDELAVLAAQAKQVEDIKAFSLEELDQDVAGSPRAAESSGSRGTVGVATYAAVVDFIGDKMRDIARRRRAVQAEREKLAPAVEASKKSQEELHGLTQLEETKVFVTVEGTSPGDAKLQLTYLLPGATWESTHELRAAESDATTAEINSFAIVTQATGEDWNDAELTFSTQSSTAALHIPELEALTFGDTHATQSIETRSASFTRAEQAFKGQNLLWNKRVQRELGTSFEERYRTNFESLQVTQTKTVQIFQSLQRRGTTTQFKALSPARVSADGRSVRIPIGRSTLKAKKTIVAAPETSLNAAQTLQMVNDSGQSLLPGSVALYQAGAFLGVTNVDFVADGEEFAVFLNVADQLKLSRVLDKKHSALVRKQRTQMQLAFFVTVENLSGKPMTLTLADRLPVSEDKDIVISGVKITPEARPDSKGILRWPLTLQPKEKRRFDIQYRIEYPPTLVLEMKRNQATEAAASPAGAPPGMPALPAPRSRYDLKKDIQEFEEAL